VFLHVEITFLSYKGKGNSPETNYFNIASVVVYEKKKKYSLTKNALHEKVGSNF
jgi:hypothetical protein